MIMAKAPIKCRINLFLLCTNNNDKLTPAIMAKREVIGDMSNGDISLFNVHVTPKPNGNNSTSKNVTAHVGINNIQRLIYGEI
jgi:hypothetical protein